MLAIDVDALTTKLQDEGATLFVNAWHERMGVSAALIRVAAAFGQARSAAAAAPK